MSEGYRGGMESFDTWKANKAEHAEVGEIRETLQEIDRLLADLLEKGGEWTAAKKAAVRALIQQLLQTLGVKSLDDYQALAALYERIHESFQRLQAPENFPSREDFRQALVSFILTDNSRSEKLPPVPQEPNLDQLIRYAQEEWGRVEPRSGLNIVDYLYNLGIILSTPHMYEVIFPESDSLSVNRWWAVQNGRHRILTLKALGRRFVEDGGLESWVRVHREE